MSGGRRIVPDGARGANRMGKQSALPAEEPPQPGRRRLLSRLWIGLTAVATAEALWIGASFFRRRPPEAERQAVHRIVAGPLDSFAPGSVTAFPNGRFYLVRLDDGGLLALHRTCTHLGCTVPWIESERRFVCPCHASAFDITGEVLSAPAPRPLDLFPVRVENGIIVVDVAAPIRREAFDPVQVRRT